MIDRVQRNGATAVLFSPGFGAGWSSWACDTWQEFALFSPEVVQWVENGKKEPIEEIIKTATGEDEPFYLEGAESLCIRWVPIGSPFKIREQDGSESIEVLDLETWRVA